KGYLRTVPDHPRTRLKRANKPKTVKQAPVLWKFASREFALGIFIDDARCWVGNQKGQVYALDHQGKVLNQFHLPDGVGCLIADDVWIYAGCDDGNVYDLTRRSPRLAYEITKKVNVLWLDICDGILTVSDEQGTVAAIDPEDQSLWKKESSGRMGWMVR